MKRARNPAAAPQSQRRTRYYRRTTCRVCGSPDLNTFADFGSMPLANSFHPPTRTADRRYPLSCAYCGQCHLVQVPDVVAPAILFKRYNYFSSASEPMVEHFRRQAELIRREYLADPNSLICEIGSNDGTFLQTFVGQCRAIGVDPADNIGPIAALRGVTTLSSFFDMKTAATVRKLYGAADVIFTANCFAHIDDLDGFMHGIVKLLSDDGVFIFENHRFAHMLRTSCFDQIYHEHLCYYTLKPIEYLMKRFGMHVIDVRLIPTQGESFQIRCARAGSAHSEQPSVEQIRREESDLRLDQPETYVRLARAITRRQNELRDLLEQLRSAGKRIVGYGAPGKASVLLNAMGIDHNTIEYAIDSTPVKHGCLIPGTGIPIKPPDALRTDTPDYLLLLAWNYADAILEKEQALRERGVKFILPMPELRIL